MKNYLILDSSNADLIVALINEKEVLTKTQYKAWQRQSEMMIPEIKKSVELLNLKFEDFYGVVVTIGPGSYTGIRIALTIAKTLALSLNLKVFPVSSLHAMADYSFPSICLINARSNRSYIGVFEKEQVLIEDQIMSNENALDFISKHPDYKVFGDLEYLEKKAEKSDFCKQIIHLLPFLKESENPILIKPIYLKETYETNKN